MASTASFFQFVACVPCLALFALRGVELSNLYTSAAHHFVLHLLLVVIAWCLRPSLRVLSFALLFGLLKFQIDVAVYKPPQADLSGRFAVVTGASSGIGLALSRKLASMGATVVMGCRSVEKCKALNVFGDSHCMDLDLADLESVQKFASSVSKRFPRIDYLVNNAGFVASPGGRTKQGLEEHFGVMHIGHFLLTNALLPALQSLHPEGLPARVVNHASAAMYGGYFHESFFTGDGEGDMRGEITDGCPLTISEVQSWLGNLSNSKYYGLCPLFGAYSRAKFAQVLFTRELQRRADTDNSSMRKMVVSTLHPGSVQSGIVPITDLLVRPTEGGADVLMYCLLEDFAPGSYIDELMRPHDLMRPHQWAFPMSLPSILFRSALGADSDVKVQERLWEVSSKLTEQYL